MIIILTSYVGLIDKKPSILEYIELYSKKVPNKLCIIEKDSSITYQQLWKRIYGFSSYLINRGLRKNDNIVVIANHSISFFIAEFAIQLAGGIFIPLEKDIGVDKLNEIVLFTNAKMAIADKKYELKCNLINFDVVGNDVNNSVKIEDVVFPLGEETSEILFTTGTTGVQKGVEMSFEGSVAVAENVLYGVEMKQDNIDMIPVPLNHSYGLRRCYANFINGSTIVLLKSVVLLKTFFEMIEEHKVSALSLVPSALSAILKFGSETLGRYSKQIDYIQTSGDALPEQNKNILCELLPNTRLYNFYGSSEAGCSCILDYNSNRDLISCIGKPTKNSNIIFHNEKNEIFNATRINPGLIATKGSMLMKGYYRDSELTNLMLKNGYICSNDLGYRDDSGNVYIIGRQDDVINVGGNKVSPNEIEDEVMLMDEIEDCACIPISDDYAGQVPKLFVVIKEGAYFSQQLLLNFLSNRLEPFKVPKEIETINIIPRTINGKIKRNMLK